MIKFKPRDTKELNINHCYLKLSLFIFSLLQIQGAAHGQSVQFNPNSSVNTNCQYSHLYFQSRDKKSFGKAFVCRDENSSGLVFLYSSPGEATLSNIHTTAKGLVIKSDKFNFTFKNKTYNAKPLVRGASRAYHGEADPSLALNFKKTLDIITLIKDSRYILGMSGTQSKKLTLQKNSQFHPTAEFDSIRSKLLASTYKQKNKIKNLLESGHLIVNSSLKKNLICNTSTNCSYAKCEPFNYKGLTYKPILYLRPDWFQSEFKETDKLSAYVSIQSTSGKFLHSSIKSILHSSNQELKLIGKDSLLFSEQSVSFASSDFQRLYNRSQIESIQASLPTQYDHHSQTLYEQSFFDTLKLKNSCPQSLIKELTQRKKDTLEIQEKVNKIQLATYIDQNYIPHLIPLTELKTDSFKLKQNLWVDNNLSIDKVNNNSYDSLLSENPARTSTAKEAVNDILKNSGIDFSKIYSGCEFRAQVMIETLKKHNIYAEQIWLKGKLKPQSRQDLNWFFHTAPIIAIQTKDGVQNRVIDPGSGSIKLLTIKEWVELSAVRSKGAPLYTPYWPFVPNHSTQSMTYTILPAEILRETDTLMHHPTWESGLLNSKKVLDIIH